MTTIAANSRLHEALAASAPSRRIRGDRWSRQRTDVAERITLKHNDDTAWPVTNADCLLLIAISVAALLGAGVLTAWTLSNILSF